MIRSAQIATCAIGVLAIVVTTELTLAQQPVLPSDPSHPASVLNASGSVYLSQFANPALRGSLYLTPQWPITGYYPLFPGALVQAFRADGVKVGPLSLIHISEPTRQA